MARAKNAARKMIPPSFRRAMLARTINSARAEFGSKSLRESFETVYEKHLWGEGPDSPSSGSGSSTRFGVPYAYLVRVVMQREAAGSVADLGCGDFTVGRLIATSDVDYIGVDIVPALVEHNDQLYGSDRVKFTSCDLTEDSPPIADVALLRQVLQHLSNEEIMRVLRHCAYYKVLLITEHLPEGTGWTPNLDKPHGPDIRLFDGSGVLLEAPPFSIPVVELEVIPHGGSMGGVLRTVEVRGSDLTQILRSVPPH